MVTVDNFSEAGSWRREWDRQSHTVTEYMAKINELRQRNQEYLVEIAKRDEIIEQLKEELHLVHKYIYGGSKRGTED